MICKADLFGMDGTLVDSTRVVELSWTKWAERHNFLRLDVLAFSHGRPRSATMNHFFPARDHTAELDPRSQGSPSAGIFSLAFREDQFGVAVGGDYSKPEMTAKISVFSTDSGRFWKISKTSPHRYRSAVAYEEKTKTWITVGPNGTDISTDDGRNWRPLTPTPQDAPDADKNWNALSLPFAVGPKGRIGKLRTNALPAHRP